jgi:hypothetical protein
MTLYLIAALALLLLVLWLCLVWIDRRKPPPADPLEHHDKHNPRED